MVQRVFHLQASSDWCAARKASRAAERMSELEDGRPFEPFISDPAPQNPCYREPSYTILLGEIKP